VHVRGMTFGWKWLAKLVAYGGGYCTYRIDDEIQPGLEAGGRAAEEPHGSLAGTPPACPPDNEEARP